MTPITSPVLGARLSRREPSAPLIRMRGLRSLLWGPSSGVVPSGPVVPWSRGFVSVVPSALNARSDRAWSGRSRQRVRLVHHTHELAQCRPDREARARPWRPWRPRRFRFVHPPQTDGVLVRQMHGFDVRNVCTPGRPRMTLLTSPVLPAPPGRPIRLHPPGPDRPSPGPGRVPAMPGRVPAMPGRASLGPGRVPVMLRSFSPAGSAGGRESAASRGPGPPGDALCT